MNSRSAGDASPRAGPCARGRDDEPGLVDTYRIVLGEASAAAELESLDAAAQRPRAALAAVA